METNLQKIIKQDKDLTKKITQQLKDSDGDKYIDAVDCDPNDKNKQGLLHNILKKVKDKYSDIKEKQEQNRTIRAEIESKIAQGTIKTETDVTKHYTYGSQSGDYAKRLVRQKQIREAKDKAVFEVRKKMIVEEAKQKIKNKFQARQNFSGNMDFNFGLGQPKPQPKQKKSTKKKQGKTQQQLFHEQIMKL